MAKKETEDKNLETDGLDDLDDLDLPELDLGIDPGSDDRSPVKKVSAGFVQGVKDDLTDHRKIPDRMKSLLPEQYSSTFETADATAGTLGELYNTFRRETRDGVRDIKKTAHSLIKEHESKIPERFRERLKQLTETETERRGPSQEELRNTQVADSMAAIFDAQNEAQEEERKEERAEKTLRDVMDHHRHEGQMELLRGLRSDVARQVSYQDQIAARWQRKSLELQYRQLFVGRDLLKVAEDSATSTKEALRDLVKNTALPDYRKIEITEAAGQKFRDAIMGGLGRRAMNFGTDLRNNLARVVTERSRNLGGMFSQAASFRDQTAGMGDMIDPAVMAGRMGGGTVSDIVIRRMLGMGRGRLQEHGPTMQGGNTLERAVRDFIPFIQQRVSSGELLSPMVPFSDSINRFAQEVVPVYGRSDVVTGGANIADSYAPAVYDQLTRRSIVEIIPGYLARINENVERLYGGDTGVGTSDPDHPGGGGTPGGRLQYDLHTGKFVRQDELKDSLARSIVKREDGERVRDRVSILVNALDPEGQLSADERHSLGLQLMETASDGKSYFNPVDFYEGRFHSSVPQEHRDGLREFITERFGIVEEYDDKGRQKVRMHSDPDTATLRNQLSQQFKGLKEDLPDPVQQIQAYMDLGMRDQLEELGVIKRDDDGRDIFDRNTYLKSLQSGRWGEELTDEDRDRIIQEDEARRVEQWYREKEEIERREKAKREAKERFDKTWVGKTTNQVRDTAQRRLAPVKEFVDGKAKQASTKTGQIGSQIAEFYRQHDKGIRAALSEDDPKAAVKEYLQEQSDHIIEEVRKRREKSQDPKEFVLKQTAAIRELSKRHGVDTEAVEKWTGDLKKNIYSGISDPDTYTRLPLTGKSTSVTEQVQQPTDKPATHTEQVQQQNDRIRELTGQTTPEGGETKSVDNTLKGKVERGTKWVSDRTTDAFNTVVSPERKKAVMDFTNSQSKRLQQLMGDKNFTQDKAQAFITEQTKKVEELAKKRGLSKAEVDVVVKDTRDTLEKELTRAGGMLANVPHMPSFVGQVRDYLKIGKKEEETEPSVTELPYTTLQSPYSESVQSDHQDVLAEQLGVGSYQEAIANEQSERVKERRKAEEVTATVAGWLGDTFTKVRQYGEDLVATVQDDPKGTLTSVKEDMVGKLERAEEYLTDVVNQSDGDGSLLDTAKKQGREVADRATQTFNRSVSGVLKKGLWWQGDPNENADQADMEGTRLPPLGGGGTSDRTGTDSTPPTPDGVAQDSAVEETVQEILREGRHSEGELLAAVQDIRDILSDEDTSLSDADRLVEAIESTVDEEYRDTHLMLLTRIIETMQANATVAGSPESEESWFNLRDVMKKTGRLIGKTGRGLGSYYSGIFRGMGSAASGAGRGIGAALGGLGRGTGSMLENMLGSRSADRPADVYLADGSNIDPWTGKPTPVLTKRKMAQGRYMDSETRRPIKTLKALGDVKGDVLEIVPGQAPTVAISQNELAEGLVDRNGKPLDLDSTRRGGLGAALRSGLKGLGNFYGTLLGTPFNVARTVTSKVTGAVSSYINRPIDVYVVGEEFPRLRAVIMERGGYVDATSGELVDHQDKIRGPVHDLQGNEVLSMDDIERGLVDVKGDSIKTSTRLLQKAGKLIRKPFDIAKWGATKSWEFLKWGGGAVKDLFSGIFNFFQKGVKEETANRQLEVLEQIRDLLDERLEKRNRWDTDGDGFRDGGWRQRFAASNEDDAGGQESEAKGPTKGMVGGITSAIAGALGLGGKEDGDGDQRGLVRTVTDNAAAAVGSAWTAAKVWGGAKAAALGITGTGLKAAALIALPKIAIAAAVVGAGYLAYRFYTKDRSYGAISKLRMVQYGFNPDDEENVARVRFLEEKLTPHTRVANGMAEIDLDRVDMEELTQGLGVDMEDRLQMERFMEWFSGRFYPVFLNHYAAIAELSSTYDLTDVDTRLDRSEKSQYLRAVKMVDGDPHPYTFLLDPFHPARRRLPSDADVVNQTFSEIASEIEEEEEKESSSRRRGFLGADLSQRNLKNITITEDLQDWDQETEEDASGPTLRELSDSRRSYTTLMGQTIEITPLQKRTIKAIDAVRYRTYGLREMDGRKTDHLSQLETYVLDHVDFTDHGAKFTGNIRDIASEFYSVFGLGILRRNQRASWRSWFEYRFLPVYLSYLTALAKLSPVMDVAKELLVNDPDKMLDIARGLIDTKVEVKDETLSVWSIMDSPWRDYMLNYNPDSTDENLEVLRQAISDNLMNEESETVEDERSVSQSVTEELKGPAQEREREEEEDRSPRTLGDSVAEHQQTSSRRSGDSFIDDNEGVSGVTGASSSGGGGATASSVRIPSNEGIEAVMAMMAEKGIDDPVEQAMMLAQFSHESGNFTRLTENLNYDTGGLRRTFKRHRISDEDIQRYGRRPGQRANQEAIANIVYGGKFGRDELGNIHPGDGWKYRGRGFIQLTGRANYQRLTNATGIDYVNNPELLEEPEHAARASIWWWKDRHGGRLRAAAQRGDVDSTTKQISGGNDERVGIAQRRNLFHTYHRKAETGELGRMIAEAQQKLGDEEEQLHASTADTPNQPSRPTQTEEVVSQPEATGAVASRQSAGQLGSGSGSASESPTSSSEGEESLNGMVAASWSQDTPAGMSEARREASNTTYVGGDITPSTDNFRDTQVAAERREREQRVSYERDEMARRDQHESARALTELVNLTRKGVSHQERMDRHLGELLALTREQAKQPRAQPVPAEDHRPDTTQRDLIAEARRQGRSNPSELVRGAVSVARRLS